MAEARKALARLDATGRASVDTDAEPRFRIYAEAELATLPAPSWLLEGIIPFGGLVVLFGPPGSGKSFVALAWAMSVATGRAWLDHGALWSPVLYVVAEGGRGVAPRVKAFRDAHELIQADSDSAYFTLDAPNLLSSADVDALVDDIRASDIPGNPGLIVLDTLARLMPGGDENSSKDVGLVVAAADRLRSAMNCAVLILHHTTKHNGDVERGSSALRGAADAMFSLKNEERALTLECVKQKDAEIAQPLQLRLATASDSCVVVPADQTDAAPKALTAKAQKALVALREHFPGAESGVAAWLKVAGLSDSSFYRAVKQLDEFGYITKQKGRWVLSVAGEALLSDSHPTPKRLP